MACSKILLFIIVFPIPFALQVYYLVVFIMFKILDIESLVISVQQIQLNPFSSLLSIVMYQDVKQSKPVMQRE